MAHNVKITAAYKGIRSLNLGMGFVGEHKLEPGKQYPIVVDGMEEDELSGTLQANGLIGGLAAMYARYPHLVPETEVAIDFDGAAVLVHPPAPPAPPPAPEVPAEEPPPEGAPAAEQPAAAPAAPKKTYVLDTKNSTRVFIPPYAHGSLNSWEPKGEPDVYMVFGRLAEFTDYRYCCASSMEVLRKLGIAITPKPDAILIEAGTNRYVIAEFEMISSGFTAGGHKKEDIDVLVCWRDDVTDAEQRDLLPSVVLSLYDKIKELVKTGDLQI